MIADGGLLELLDQLPGRVQIHQVVVGELLALQLLGARDAAVLSRIQRGRLMRILAIAQVERARRADARASPAAPDVPSAPTRASRAADRAIVGGRQRERLLRQPPQRRLAEFAVASCSSSQDRGVIVGRRHHRHILVILGRRADQGRSADIDVLDQFRQRDARLAPPLSRTRRGSPPPCRSAGCRARPAPACARACSAWPGCRPRSAD